MAQVAFGRAHRACRMRREVDGPEQPSNSLIPTWITMLLPSVRLSITLSLLAGIEFPTDCSHRCIAVAHNDTRRLVSSHACQFADNRLFPVLWRALSILAALPLWLELSVAAPCARRIGLRSATSCAFGIDLGTSLTRPLQLIFRQRETNSRFPARRSVCARRLHFPFSISYLLLFLECATVPSRPGTPLTDNGPKIAARPRTKLAGARIGCP